VNLQNFENPAILGWISEVILKSNEMLQEIKMAGLNSSSVL